MPTIVPNTFPNKPGRQRTPSRLALLWLILMTGLGVRLAYVLVYPQQPVRGDASGYVEVARTLVETGEYDPHGRTPLYPTFLALTYAIGGRSWQAVRVVQAVIVTLTAWVTWRIGLRLLDERRALIAAALVSVYPGFISYSGLLLTETLFTLLLTLLTLFVVLTFRDGRSWCPAGAGACLGAATLCRAEILGLPVLIFTGLAAVRGFRVAARRTAIMSFVALATIAPWFVRSYVKSQERLPVSAGFGVGATFWLSSHPEDWTEWHSEREPLKSLLQAGGTPEEINARLLAAGVRNVRRYPMTYVWLCAKRFVRFWIGGHSYTIAGLERGLSTSLAAAQWRVVLPKMALFAVNMALLVCAAVGTLGARSQWQTLLPLLLVIAYVNGVHVILFSTARYQIPIMPLVLILVAVCAANASATPRDAVVRVKPAAAVEV